jgi:CDP-diacylglycerol--glycerol-3-phosphate 3-phosphatidyltransferase/cardiolipin synthase
MTETPETPIVDDIIDTPEEAGGVFADVLTILRMLLMPVVVYLIWRGWQPVEKDGIDLGLTLLASFLFVIAAATDIFDDYLGGTSRSAYRKFGYLDDIADTVLVIGVLAALLFVTARAGYLSWTFAIPAGVLIAREVVIGLFKGFELSRYGWPDTLLSNAKAGLAMLATCLLLASPWLQSWIDRLRAGDDVAAVFAATSPWVWVVGEVILWIAALLSLITAAQILRTDFRAAAND